MVKRQYIFFSLAMVLTAVLGSCSKSQSYSELLREEEHACNWYLASRNVSLELPDDPSDLITGSTLREDGTMWGEEAPFYKLDADGYVYMQIVRADYDDMVENGDLVYFRYLRQSIKDLWEDVSSDPGGNSDYLPNGTASFIYKNTYLSSTTTWGTGIQMPLQYVGYNSEVNLVLKSYYGFTEEQIYCVPYIINLKYFKPEY
ncbi:MAG: DUF4827 family protein [Muribaculaceae bacterium]|nr:DUF4827 family protein [Muribaculaceae bacterium]